MGQVGWRRSWATSPHTMRPGLNMEYPPEITLEEITSYTVFG